MKTIGNIVCASFLTVAVAHATVYEGSRLKEISFPLGGIGSGCIGVAGNGRLVDWEIFNSPNKNSVNGFSHFAIRAEHAGKLVDARILHGDLAPPYGGEAGIQDGFGFGTSQFTLAGMPHFKDVVFRGEYPIAELTFTDPRFPGQVKLTAFNPFIPLNDKDSSLPAAFFEIEIHNTGSVDLDYTVALTVKNPSEKSANAYSKSMLALGNLTAATDASETSAQEYWYRPSFGFPYSVPVVMYWREFLQPGKLIARNYATPGNGDHGTLAAHFRIAAGKTEKARFILSWSFPDRTAAYGKNYYSTLFKDSAATARYGLDNWDRLDRETRLFKNALFASTLPPAVLDAVSANISILKTPTCLRLEDGSFWGWEGCFAKSGCFFGTCAHVYNYAYALPFLFPSLERSIRNLDYRYNLAEDGRMGFRLALPAGSAKPGAACVDGQFGNVIKVYRDWKISGDTAWLKGIWPAVKKSIEYAWAKNNAQLWDPDKTGVITGTQHNTLDIEVFGANSWLTGYYLAALKAGAEMAEVCGEMEKATEYRTIFLKGKAVVDKELFNGEYYGSSPTVNLKDKNTYGASGKYWDPEIGEMRFQIGGGCGIDQVVAQWHANLAGLGEIFNPAQTRRALQALYKYNYKSSFREVPNTCRYYALNDEAGTVMFSWPAGRYKPVFPIAYADETMSGFEYAVGAQMIMNGMIKEGCDIVQAVRNRYDGEKRNPWNEMEAGSNYARSMAAYSLLNAFSGFTCNLAEGEIGFNPPRQLLRPLKFFWSLGTGWGVVEITDSGVKLKVLYGTVNLQRFRLPDSMAHRKDVRVVVNGNSISGFSRAENLLKFEQPLKLTPSDEFLVK